MNICKNCKDYASDSANSKTGFCFFHDEDVDFSHSCNNFQNNNNPINPNHYKQGKIECIDACESAIVNKKGIEAACVFNIVKYLWRYESKNGIEDVKKAQWYLEKLIEKLTE